MKRLKITKNGKILHGRSFTSHLQVKKSKKRRKNLKKNILLTGFYAKKVRKFMNLRKAK